jgi:hypothetical protein
MPKDLSSSMMAALFLTMIFWLFGTKRCHSLRIVSGAGFNFMPFMPNSKKHPCCREMRTLLDLARTHRMRCKSLKSIRGRKLGLSTCMSWRRDIISLWLLNAIFLSSENVMFE